MASRTTTGRGVDVRVWTSVSRCFDIAIQALGGRSSVRVVKPNVAPRLLLVDVGLSEARDALTSRVDVNFHFGMDRDFAFTTEVKS